MNARPLVYDCFTFFNELDLLEIRLNELSPYVHRFVLAESNVTFTGKKKPMYFAENQHRFKDFLDRITYVPVTDMPDTSDAWRREHHQRRALIRGLDVLEMHSQMPEPIVLLSDVDEIPYLTDWEPRGMSCWWTRFHYYFADVVGIEPPRIKTTCSVSHSRLRIDHKGDFQDVRDWRHHWPDILSCGWHFSYFGGVAGSTSTLEAISTKLGSFAHDELIHHNTHDNIARALRDAADLFGREGYKFERVDRNTISLPHYLMANQEKFKSLWSDSLNWLK